MPNLDQKRTHKTTTKIQHIGRVTSLLLAHGIDAWHFRKITKVRPWGDIGPEPHTSRSATTSRRRPKKRAQKPTIPGVLLFYHLPRWPVEVPTRQVPTDMQEMNPENNHENPAYYACNISTDGAGGRRVAHHQNREGLCLGRHWTSKKTRSGRKVAA